MVDMTANALARRTGLPIEIIESGIAALESPDRHSRTPDEEGRRIRRIDDRRPWGWYIVNHEKYRAIQGSETIRLQNRERKRRQRGRCSGEGHESSQPAASNHGESQPVTVSHAPSRMSRHTDTDTDTYTKSPSPPCSDRDGFSLFWDRYPKQQDREDAEREWEKLAPDSGQQEEILAGLERAKLSSQWRRAGEDGKPGRYVAKPATFLRKRQWKNCWVSQLKPARSSTSTHAPTPPQGPLTDERRAVGRSGVQKSKERIRSAGSR